MSRIFLLRHAHSTANARGILAGRMEGISLSPKGKKQQQELLERLVESEFQQVISSPMQRCLETINGFKDSPEVVSEFQEVDYGDWTGKKMSSLARNKAWREIHKHPASVRFPNGETLPEVQTRALLGLDKYISNKAKNVLVSTHADVVKVILLHALGSHLNNIDKISVDNASFSIIEINGNDYRVLTVNDKHTHIKKLLA